MPGYISDKPLSLVDKKLEAERKKYKPKHDPIDDDTGFKSKPKKKSKLTRADIMRV